MTGNVSEPAGSTLLNVYVPPIARPGRRERDRVIWELASVTVIGKDEIEAGKHYGRWAGGWVEITDKLLVNCICPADLLDVKCEWDNVLPEGCRMIRLCKVSSKYTTHVCTNDKSRHGENTPQPKPCGHLHSEVDISCRSMVNHRRCKQVLEKNRMCSAGHDLEAARIVARNSYHTHIAAARAAVNTN